jgi:hypothetical protein
LMAAAVGSGVSFSFIFDGAFGIHGNAMRSASTLKKNHLGLLYRQASDRAFRFGFARDH